MGVQPILRRASGPECERSGTHPLSAYQILGNSNLQKP